MTVVTWFMKKPRLSKLIDAAGGTTVVNALRVAEQNTAPLRDEALAAVDDVLAQLEALTFSPPDDPTPWLSRVYALSASLLDVAGPFGLDDMCKAAYSLCELTDRQRRSERCEPPSVKVHVASLRLLRQAGEPPESRKQILAGLEKVLAREIRTAG